MGTRGFRWIFESGIMYCKGELDRDLDSLYDSCSLSIWCRAKSFVTLLMGFMVGFIASLGRGSDML